VRDRDRPNSSSLAGLRPGNRPSLRPG